MKNQRIAFVALFAMLAISLAGCKKSAKKFFTYWNDCDSLDSLVEFVEDVTDEKSANFIPQKDRIATFDMDGTILAELYPTYFEYNILEYRVLDDPSYKDKASDSERAAGAPLCLATVPILRRVPPKSLSS